jgi:GMP synthase (glutamine-hydrolysing)
MGIKVEVVEASKAFFSALKGSPTRRKREAITQIFIKMFRQTCGEKQGKIPAARHHLTDVDETVAELKRQHNVFDNWF